MDERNQEWVRVYTSTFPHKISIVKAVLEENQIASFEVNKKDSAYIAIGEIDLFVNKDDSVLAEFLIKSHNL